ncbi:glycosyltransferase [Pseudoalteromonas sp. Scap03]|uniref:glycosyltransferase n=1 Tax=unclassified Pseudoalteromonas TaxID=194690 RepID=UPI0015BD7F61|nr:MULTISPECIES: glycosyltransferase [unclassified Pseudoalteromonas]NWL15281.1 glycosyltransferase [Pseudoalteromonas sp. Scap03]QLE80433.1 glycosyltransferase [Pseudoalteromonas sp. Scap25]QLE88376.1 glycosyltransferase [Pseudoalteromonas sp. Scap06]
MIKESLSVGIYMPTKNRVELLKKAVSSVLSQTYPNFKLLIIDDGSSDGTHEYLKTISDPRVSFIRNEISEKACKARNKAIKALDTDLVTGLDDDDVFLPERLECLVKAYDPKYSFVCSGYFWDYGAHKKSLFNKEKVISLSAALDLNQCSNQILVSRERVLEVGGFDPDLPALQDHDLWVRLIAKYGDAYRIGKELYIVNDDQELERISSVNNKLRAIDLFEAKHKKIMSVRNKENFAFYRKKIMGEKVSFMELLSSSKHGLFTIKARHTLAQSLSKLAKYRLDYMHNKKVDQPLVNWLLNVFVPLLATGGPGASRVILLSSCIYFLGAMDTASFGSDFFILMLLNTMFSQSFGFFILKQDYRDSFTSISKQSLSGLICGLCILSGLFWMGVITNLLYCIPLFVVLHFYYLFRFNRVAKQGFFLLAMAECLISIICLVAPVLISSDSSVKFDAPYIIYLVALLSGLFFIALFDWQSLKAKATEKIPNRKVFNIAISTTASVFALFCFPYTAKLIFEPEVASYVALTISCFSIAMLIPRTQANKNMPLLGSHNLSLDNIVIVNNKYCKLILVSCLASSVISFMYLYILGAPKVTAFMASIAITSIFISSQYGFIFLTSLSLRGKEDIVAKLNLLVLGATLIAISLLVFKVVNLNSIAYLLPFICIVFAYRNMRAKQAVAQFIP